MVFVTCTENTLYQSTCMVYIHKNTDTMFTTNEPIEPMYP
jgi:hypothetical protein